MVRATGMDVQIEENDMTRYDKKTGYWYSITRSKYTTSVNIPILITMEYYKFKIMNCKDAERVYESSWILLANPAEAKEEMKKLLTMISLVQRKTETSR